MKSLHRWWNRPSSTRLDGKHRPTLRPVFEMFEDRITPTAFPTPLIAVSPAGSLVYTGSVADSISVAGESDTYTIDLDAGQTLSIEMLPAAGLQGSFDVLGPASSSIGGGSSSAAGATARAQGLSAATAGTYIINLSGLAGTTGGYSLRLTLNAVREAEGAGAATNNSIATAENIDASFTSLGAGSSRGAVLGTSDPVSINFIDISPAGTGRKVLGNGDDISRVLPAADLSGFAFPYFGTTYTSIYVSTNGIITFGAGSTIFVNGNLAASPAQPTIAAFWDDLNLLPASNGNIYYLVSGSGASQALTIQWSNALRFPAVEPPISFQAVLSANGDVQLNYGPSVSAAQIAVATTGLKKAGTTAATSQPILLNFNGLLTPAAPNQLVGANISAKYSAATNSFGLAPSGTTSPDTYAVTLTAGERNTASLTALTPSGLSISVLDGSGAVVQSGVAGTTTFTVPTSGVYYLQINGGPSADYSLVVTKNAAFESEPNDSLPSAQNITGVPAVLGALTAGSASPFAASPAPYSFTDISTTGSAIVGLVGDDLSLPAPIGFAFPFYGVSYTELYVSTNGLITFGGANNSFGNTDLGASPQQAAIAAYWDDLVVGGGVNSHVFTQLVGTGAGQQLIIQWNDLSYFPPGVGGMTFQAILSADGTIQFNYADLTAGAPGIHDEGVSATVGVRGGNSRLLASFNSANPLIGSGKSIVITQKAVDVYAITLAPSQGGLTVSTLTPGDGAGEFVNTLDPKIVLRDATGAIVATGVAGPDGRNETLSAANGLVPGATYFIEVSSDGGTSGEYVISTAITAASPSTTTLTAVPNPNLAGNPVTFTATISPSPGSAGTVTFLDNNHPVPGGSNVPVINGVATFATSGLPAGSHPFTAVFSGASGLAGSTSAVLVQVIDPGAPTTTTIVSASPNPASAQQPFTVTVIVADGVSAAGEPITLVDASNSDTVVAVGILTPGQGVSGRATILVPGGSLSVGTHNLVANYGGSASNLASSSAPFAQTIAVATTSTTLSGVFAVAAAAPEFIDISSTGTVIAALTGADDRAAPIPIGFNFPFYGMTNSDVFVSSNGLLSFVAGNPSFVNTNLVVGPPQATIAPFWDDLFVVGDATTNVFYQVVGTGNDAQLIVQWNNVSFFTDGARSGGLTFEAILGADGSIDFNYLHLSAASANSGNEGASATVGVKGTGAGAQSLLLDYNGAQPFGTLVGTNRSTTINFGGPRVISDPTPIPFFVSVAGGAATNGEQVVLIDTNHNNAVVPTTGGILQNGSTTISVVAADLGIGSHNLVAVYAGNAINAGSTSNVVTQVIAGAIPRNNVSAPEIVSVTVNGGTALAGAQRSRVASLQVVFDQPVMLDADAFLLALHATGVTYDGVAVASMGVLPSSLTLQSADNITWNVNFNGNTESAPSSTGSFDGFHSLQDGVYDFNIDASRIHPIGMASVNAAANLTTTFHRLFGDTSAAETPADGTTGVDFAAVIDTADNLALRSAFNRPSGYRADLDFNGDGAISTDDNLALRGRFNRVLRWNVL